MGLAQTRQSVTKLNHIVTAAHCDVGIPAVAVSLFPTASCRLKQLELPGALLHIRNIVDLGLVPIIHGDVLTDTNKDRACTVYSGDSILRWCDL